MSCTTYQQFALIPSCASLLTLGTCSVISGQVYVYVQKANGSVYIHSVTTDNTGKIVIDLTEPNSEFYNEYDGLYLIWVTQGGYYADESKLTVTSNGTEWQTAGVQFKSNTGVEYDNVHLEPIV